MSEVRIMSSVIICCNNLYTDRRIPNKSRNDVRVYLFYFSRKRASGDGHDDDNDSFAPRRRGKAKAKASTFDDWDDF